MNSNPSQRKVFIKDERPQMGPRARNKQLSAVLATDPCAGYRIISIERAAPPNAGWNLYYLKE